MPMRSNSPAAVARIGALAALTLISTAMLAGSAFAGAELAGTTAANFLATGSGARVLGMGGATLALPGGLGAASWNVGALGWVDGTELSLSHAGLAEGSAQEWVGAGGLLGTRGTRWSLSGLYQSEGSFEGMDASGFSTGSFNVYSMAIGGHLAQRFGDVLSVGGGAKWVSDNLGDATGSGVTFDAGVLARAGRVGVGLAAQNAGGQMKYDGSRYPFPTSYGGGVSLEDPKNGLRFDVDFNLPNAYYKNVRGGVEWMWKDRLALRAGYRAELGAAEGEALGGPAFGFGTGAHGLWLDYGYLITQNGEGQHRMGLAFHPGNLRWSPGDPFGQKGMRREFDDQQVGPPEPKKTSRTSKSGPKS